MPIIACLRHGATDWNAEGRMQGRRDVPLSAAGRADVAGWTLPADLAHDADWFASPLLRAVETAELMMSRRPSTSVAPRAFSILSVGTTSPRRPSGSLSTSSRSGRKLSAVCWMMAARIAIVCSRSMCKPSDWYSPLVNLITPGIRTKSTRGRKSKLPMIGEPDRISTETPL